jgi:hypothetical protein
MTQTQNDPHGQVWAAKDASWEGRSDPNRQRNETVSIHYHIDTKPQSELHICRAAVAAITPAPSTALPLAVRHVQRLTGAPESSARLIAELAGLSLSFGDAA